MWPIHKLTGSTRLRQLILVLHITQLLPYRHFVISYEKIHYLKMFKIIRQFFLERLRGVVALVATLFIFRDMFTCHALTRTHCIVLPFRVTKPHAYLFHLWCIRCSFHKYRNTAAAKCEFECSSCHLNKVIYVDH